MPAGNKVQIIVEVLRQKGDELQKISKDLKQLGADGQTALDKVDAGANKAQGELSKMATAVKALALAFVVMKAKELFTESIEAAHKAESAFMGLAAIARFAGESIGESLGAASRLAADGLMTVGEASLALQNLLSRGFDLGQAVEMLNRLKDSAAFNRQMHLSLGQAVVSATEGLKNENSILVDNAGVTKNVSIMWKEYAAQLEVGAESLTIAQKRQAEYNGLLRETEGQVGNAARYLDTAAGAQARMNAEILKSKVALGEALMPAITIAYKAVAWLANASKEYMRILELWYTSISKIVGKLLILGKAVASGAFLTKAGRDQTKKELQALDDYIGEHVDDINARYSGAVKVPDIGEDTGKRRTDVVLAQQKEAVQDFVSGVKQALSTLDLSIDKDKVVESFDAVSQRLEEFQQDYTDKLRGLQLDEKNHANAVKAIQKEILEAKKRTAEQALSAIKSAIDQSIAEEKRLAQEIKRIEASQLRDEESGQDILRGLARQQMTEEEVWWDRRKEAYDKLQEAQEAAGEGEFERARDLAKRAQEIGRELTKTPEGMDNAWGFADAEEVVKRASATIKSTWDEQKDAAVRAQRETKDKIEELKQEFEELQKKVEAFRGELLKMAEEEIDLKIRIDSAEAEAKIAELTRPEEKIIAVREVPVSDGEGYARGGRLAGYGGGDRMRALLEAGEFVIRKEAVKRYGSGLFEALNNMRLSLPRMPAPEIPRMQPTWAAGGLAGGGGRTVNLNLNVGGQSYPVISDEAVANALERHLTRLGKTR